MRIAYLGIKGLPAKGGADRVVEAMVRRLSTRHDTTVYCSRDYTPEDARVPGVTMVRLPSLQGKHVRSPSLVLLASLHALLLGRYDLVHLHNVETSFVLPLLRLRYKVISTAHGSPVRSPRKKWGPLAQALMALMEYPYTMLSSCLTSVSLVDADYFQSRYKKVVHYLPNGVDACPPVDQKTAQATLSAHGLDAGNYILFAAGRVDPTKGCHLLLEAFQKLGCAYRLAVVGDLTQIPAYERQLRQMADDRVRFIPFISERDELFGIVQGCRFFVFPSMAEGMSMMLLEVASLGVPIVCSDIPENAVLPSTCAVFFESGNSESLRAKLQWTIDHPEAVRALGRRAQTWVSKHYLWDDIVERYDELYRIVGGMKAMVRATN